VEQGLGDRWSNRSTKLLESNLSAPRRAVASLVLGICLLSSVNSIGEPADSDYNRCGPPGISYIGPGLPRSDLHFPCCARLMPSQSVVCRKFSPCVLFSPGYQTSGPRGRGYVMHLQLLQQLPRALFNLGLKLPMGLLKFVIVVFVVQIFARQVQGG
jgi:hypothetical protein